MWFGLSLSSNPPTCCYIVDRMIEEREREEEEGTKGAANNNIISKSTIKRSIEQDNSNNRLASLVRDTLRASCFFGTGHRHHHQLHTHTCIGHPPNQHRQEERPIYTQSRPYTRAHAHTFAKRERQTHKEEDDDDAHTECCCSARLLLRRYSS